MTIYHIVLVKFTEDATLAQKEGWKLQILNLKDKIPEIKELICGEKLPHHLNAGWEDGAIFTFNTDDDLRTYTDSPPHKAYQQATNEQILDKLIYDIQV